MRTRSLNRAGRLEMTETYRDDLAYIHDAGFGNFARAAAAVLVEMLHRSAISDGLVIDLGCGSGILSEAVSQAGYDVLGIDISPAMVAMARMHAAGRFSCRVAADRDASSFRCHCSGGRMHQLPV